MSEQRQIPTSMLITQAATVVAAACGLALLILPMLLHNHHLVGVEEAFSLINHPENTHPLGGVSRVGLLVGSGNHCDFFVGQVRSTTEDWESVAMHYHTLGRKFAFDLAVSKFEDGVLQVERDAIRPPFDLESLSGWGVEKAPQGEWIYAVYVADPGHAPEHDYRCY